MQYKNIMVAYDGSEPSQEALVVAKDMIGDDPEAVMHVVSIIPIGAVDVGIDSPIEPISGAPHLFPDMEMYEALLADAKQATERGVEEAIADTVADVVCAVEVSAHAAMKPATGICEYASDHSVDMIIMGRRGIGGLRAMLGSVSYAVLHEAEIPVVTVR